ncbi:MAG TPA: hypothetical protein VMD59_06440, partial [Acidimicrobiales bacterium]|nr:hypothetical protein [Acidimicrobiales bacterium]
MTSFSSKSGLALNLSTGGRYVTFMGYVAPSATADVSASNTPGDVDPTNPVTTSYYRAVAQLGPNGAISYTETNAYSGDNGRAAIFDDAGDEIYTAGNAGNGGTPEPEAVVLGVGAQILAPANAAESAQSPAQPTAVGNFNLTELGDKADKSAKDDNFRSMTIYDNVLYYTKGSGSNGVDTVYCVDTAGGTCPNGSGLPATSATLPTPATAISYSTNDSALGLSSSNPGLAPTNMCVLNGFPTAIAKKATDASDYPFGIWFASPTVLYVADEGAGDNTYSSSSGTYTAAAASQTAGLQTWVFSGGQWNLAYVAQSGLGLGQPYSVNGYPNGLNSGPGGTGLPWAPATDGLRNLTGQVNANGTVTIWATTSTVSGGGDQGADPNELVSITDDLAATSLPADESFDTVLAPKYGTVVRGVSFTPGTVVGSSPSSTAVTGPTTPTTGTSVTYTATVTGPSGSPV